METIPWRFREAANLPQPNQGRVPVICDGTKVVCDSWKIAEYLEDAYPDRPSCLRASAATLMRVSSMSGQKLYCCPASFQ